MIKTGQTWEWKCDGSRIVLGQRRGEMWTWADGEISGSYLMANARLVVPAPEDLAAGQVYKRRGVESVLTASHSGGLCIRGTWYGWPYTWCGKDGWSIIGIRPTSGAVVRIGDMSTDGRVRAIEGRLVVVERMNGFARVDVDRIVPLVAVGALAVSPLTATGDDLGRLVTIYGINRSSSWRHLLAFGDALAAIGSPGGREVVDAGIRSIRGEPFARAIGAVLMDMVEPDAPLGSAEPPRLSCIDVAHAIECCRAWEAERSRVAPGMRRLSDAAAQECYLATAALWNELRPGDGGGWFAPGWAPGSVRSVYERVRGAS